MQVLQTPGVTVIKSGWITEGITYHLNVWGHSGQEVQQLIVVDAVRVSQFFGELVHPWKLKQQWFIIGLTERSSEESCTDSESLSFYFTV